MAAGQSLQLSMRRSERDKERKGVGRAAGQSLELLMREEGRGETRGGRGTGSKSEGQRIGGGRAGEQVCAGWLLRPDLHFPTLL
jgi:hypothetical protein